MSSLKLHGDFKVQIKFGQFKFYFWLNTSDIKNLAKKTFKKDEAANLNEEGSKYVRYF
jgi:hypothetical protein